MTNNEMVDLQNISMLFPAVKALDDVSLSLVAGEVHGLIGENGAGKSTLMRILAGLQQPTAGRVLIDDREVHFKHPADAARAGVAMIHQELNLIDELSVAENIYLGREPATVTWVHDRAMRRSADALLASLDCPLDPAAPVRTLSIAQKQMVEIAKAVSQNARVLIMDEPTAVLTARETRALFALIARLKAQGVSIVYISHILGEVLTICDHITVMRDGRVVQTFDDPRTITEHDLARAMVGRELGDFFPTRSAPTDRVVLSVNNLTLPGKVSDASFNLHAGEILGFAGLIGAGRTELAEAIAGLRRRTAGEVHIRQNDEELPVPPNHPTKAVQAGIAYLSEDRKGTGLAIDLSIVDNTTLVSLRRYGTAWVSRRKELAATYQHRENLQIKLGKATDPLRTLSGGNQQKVLLAKWLETRPRVLIIDEPTRGVDIGAKRQIYDLIHSLTAQGMACILISSELNEVLGLSHRIAVMRAGRIAAILDGPAATEESVMFYAAGVKMTHHGDTEARSFSSADEHR